jgi:hypothetical protein
MVNKNRLRCEGNKRSTVGKDGDKALVLPRSHDPPVFEDELVSDRWTSGTIGGVAPRDNFLATQAPTSLREGSS